MINMIKADFYRVFRGAGIYIGLGLLLLLIAMSVYDVSPGYVGVSGGLTGDESDGEGTVPSGGNPMIEGMTYEEVSAMSVSEYRKLKLTAVEYELDRDILGSNINLYYVFIFLAAVVVTADFSAGCTKNTLSSTVCRRKYFVSKVITVFLLALLLFFLNTYLVYFFNLIFNGRNFTSSLWTVTKISLLQLPPMLALVCVLLGIAFSVKKTSLYNTIAIPLDVVLQLVLMAAVQLFGAPSKIFSYLFQNMFDMLAGEPAGRYLLESYGICAAVAVVFITVGYLAFQKAEIR